MSDVENEETLEEYLIKIKRKHARHLGHATRLVGSADAITNSQTTQRPDIDKLSRYMIQLSEKIKVIEDIGEEVLNSTEDETEYNKLSDHYEEKLCKYRDKKLFYEQYIARNTKTTTPSPTTPTIPAAPQPLRPKCNLQKLELPKFDGEITKWQNFWDSFKAAVHDADYVPEIQKFQYLQSLLKGEAAICITGLSLTAANYRQAISILQKEYAQEHKIVDAHMRAINNLSSPENNFESLRSFRDNLEIHVRSLEAVGKDCMDLGEMLTSVVYNKFNSVMRGNLVRSKGDKAFTFQELQEFINTELKILKAQDSTNTDSVKRASVSGLVSTVDTPQKRFIKKPASNISVNTSKGKHCAYCKGDHYPSDCSTVQGYEARREFIRKHNLCFNCLGAGHRVPACRSRFTCYFCNRKHHRSICAPVKDKQPSTVVKDLKSDQASIPSVTENKSTNAAEIQQTVATSNGSNKSYGVLLKTAVVPVSSDNHTCDSNILLDDAAHRTFIRQSLVDELGLEIIGKDTISLSHFGATEGKVMTCNMVQVGIHCEDKKIRYVDALILPHLAVPLNVSSRKHLENIDYLKGLKLAHPLNDCEKFEIGILIGSDYYNRFVTGEQIRDPYDAENGPVAVSTKFGYVVSGPVTGKNCTDASIMNILTCPVQSDYDLSRFWDLESMGIQPPDYKDTDKKQILEYCDSSITFDDDANRYVAQFPWKSEHPSLENNYYVCKRRTLSTIDRLVKTSRLDDYAAIMIDQEQRGFIERVPDTDVQDSSSCHYIPHHPVFRSSGTTPLRIVFNASCKPSKFSPSLNECLDAGPRMQNCITAMLLRLRLYNVGIIADIEKAFLQILLADSEKDFVRFLWLENPSDPSSELISFRFRSVPFGCKSSPFILNATIFKHLLLNGSWISDLILHNIYVDNVALSLPSELKAEEFYLGARSLMQDGGFNLWCWNSNSSKIKELATVDGVCDSTQNAGILGLTWDTQEDTLSLKPLTDVSPPPVNVTKRIVFQHAAKLYDPLGIASPVSIRAKIFLQKLWKLDIDWDLILSADLHDEWSVIACDLQKVSNLTVPRCYFKNGESTDYKLEMFGDSSQMAYGAVAYLVNGENSSFLMAKSKVAPARKPLTVPQLELMAALVAARLSNHIVSELKLPELEVNLWTDSQIALSWINSTKKLPVFVENRVLEIRKLTDANSWKYCRSENNPADYLTRGMSVAELNNCNSWFNGPPFITESFTYDDSAEIPETSSESYCEINASVQNTDSDVTESALDSPMLNLCKLIDVKDFSSLNKLYRVTARVLRFINNIRNKNNKNLEEDLETEEIQYAESLWIKSVQSEYYGDVVRDLTHGKKSQLISSLRLYIDENGIVRSAGRVHNSPLHDDAKFPILMPKCDFANLVVWQSHWRCMHFGVNATIVEIRQKFWITSIRPFVKKVLKKCVICKLILGRPFKRPDSPPLPYSRVSDVPPFYYTGLDFLGPLYAGSKKTYICLFTCPSTRAIHLELVTDLTSDTFLQAFRRFTSRRSVPVKMYSDNASTFITASKQIRDLVCSNEVRDFLSQKSVSWKFITKRAPWHGGYWERLVALVKTTIKKVFGRQNLDFEELRTAITEVEAVLNDRPLTRISLDIKDDDPLTPSHLLIGRRLLTLPHPAVDDSELEDPSFIPSETTLQKRVRHRAAVIDSFKRRWLKEYLTSLREWNCSSGNTQSNLRVGMVVLVHDDVPRLRWKYGVITKLIDGIDGVVRTAVISTVNGVTNRPVDKLYPLEVDCYDINNVRAGKAADANDQDESETITDIITKPPKRQAAEHALQKIKIMNRLI